MKVFFYRHLPTQNNLNKIFIGRIDLECDQEYIQEHLEDIRGNVKNRTFAQIYCSPLLRARQSARIYFPQQKATVDRRLIERDLGDWGNIPKQTIREQFPAVFYQNGNLDFRYTPPNGEPFTDVIKRVSSFLLDLYNNHSGDDAIAVVTHNGVITAIKCLLAGTLSTEEIKFQPFLSEYSIEFDQDIIRKFERGFQGELECGEE